MHLPGSRLVCTAWSSHARLASAIADSACRTSIGRCSTIAHKPANGAEPGAPSVDTAVEVLHSTIPPPPYTSAFVSGLAAVPRAAPVLSIWVGLGALCAEVEL